MQAEELRLRLFLEGIEVPVIGASVSMSSDFPAAASIQIIATPQALRLKPRTLVHLFFKDLDSQPLTASATGVQPYSLLFCGDLISISFNKTEGTRSITLSCKDHRSYYDLAYTYLWRSYDLKGNIQGSSLEKLLKSKGAFAGANSSINFITSDGVAGFISKIFEDPTPFTPQFRNCSGVLGGVIRAIEAFTGISGNSKGGSNAFFAYASARLNLLGQLGVYSNDDTPAKLLASQHMKDLLTGKGDQLGDLTTLNQIIRYILGFIYYKMSPNTCARFKPIGSFSTEGEAKTALSKGAQELFNYITDVKKNLVAIKNELSDNPNFDESVVSRFNVEIDKIRSLCPDSLLTSISLSDPKVGSSPGDWKRIQWNALKAESSFSKSFSDPGSADWESFYGEKWSGAQQLYAYLHEIAKLVSSNSLEANNFKGFGAGIARLIIQICKHTAPRLTGEAKGEKGQLVVTYNREVFSKAGSNKIISPLQGILDLLSKSQIEVSTSFTQQTTPRLYTTLIMPDLFFGVAPKCNVLFPDMYFTLAYSRNISTEVTRLQLSTSEDVPLSSREGVDQINFYAPSTSELSSMQSKILSSDETNSAEEAWTGSRLLEHELMTGIKPEFSSMSRMMLETALLSDRKEKPARNDFYIRIANYQFLKKRLASRTMSVTGIFNPNAVVGFPMIVIDSAYVESVDTASTLKDSTSEQFIGMVVSISHSLTQQGGSTSYQLSHVRPHRSMDDEFINKLSLGVRGEPKMASLTLSYSDILDRIVSLAKLEMASPKEENRVKLKSALQELRILATITYYSGLKGSDFLVSDSYPHSQATKDGDNFMAGMRVPSTPGTFSVPRRESLTINGESKEVFILGVSVIDESPAGGVKDVAERTTAEFVKFLTGGKDQKSKILPGKYTAYASAYNVLIQEDGEAKKLDVNKLFERVDSRTNSFTLASEVLSLPIRDVTDVELINLCRFVKVKGCKFPSTAFSKVEIFYEDESGGLINPPIEEAMRPSFIDAAYASPNIGAKVYQELLGTDSVVDVEQAQLDEYGLTKGTTSVGYKGGTSRGAYGETVDVLSQEDAINYICYEYAGARNKGEFARNYIKRPFANINDVLFSENGVHFKSYASSSQINNENKRIPYMGLAIEVGECEPLMEGFIEASKEQIAYLDKSVDNRVDVRVTRSESVLEYVRSITSRGLKG